MKEDIIIKSSAPGRVCLFGEHQDYLNLPVIPCAIDLRVNIEGKITSEEKIKLNLPDINSSELVNINENLIYELERDYYKSSINVLKKKGFLFDKGFEGIVNGNIPINSGTSSSSALIVSFLNLLTQFSRQGIKLSAEEIADLAFNAEVAEFNEPGGKMDHYACALGGMFFLQFEPELKIKKLRGELKTFVLGDSGEPKDTKGILSRVKNGVINILDKIEEEYEKIDIKNENSIERVKNFSFINEDERELLIATINNYKITEKAKIELDKSDINHKHIGELLNQHHKILSEKLKISTPKIDRMIKSALDAGAFGAKINGSGGGGCMFAYAPENPEKVAEAIEKEGGTAFIVKPSEGVK